MPLRCFFNNKNRGKGVSFSTHLLHGIVPELFVYTTLSCGGEPLFSSHHGDQAWYGKAQRLCCDLKGVINRNICIWSESMSTLKLPVASRNWDEVGPTKDFYIGPHNLWSQVCKCKKWSKLQYACKLSWCISFKQKHFTGLNQVKENVY